jgi:uncharacterized membrane protein YfcA
MDTIELVAVFVWSFVVSFAGGLVGLVLGNLRLPLIVLVASSPAAGAGANVAISGAAATTAAYAHWRGGRVSWGILGVGAAAAMPAAYFGAHFTGRLDEPRLLHAMAAVLVISGLSMAAQAILG